MRCQWTFSLWSTVNSIPKLFLLPSVVGLLRECLQELFGGILFYYRYFKVPRTIPCIGGIPFCYQYLNVPRTIPCKLFIKEFTGAHYQILSLKPSDYNLSPIKGKTVVFQQSMKEKQYFKTFLSSSRLLLQSFPPHYCHKKAMLTALQAPAGSHPHTDPEKFCLDKLASPGQASTWRRTSSYSNTALAGSPSGDSSSATESTLQPTALLLAH